MLIDLDDGPDRIDFGGSIYLAIAAEDGVESRRSRIYGGRDWVRLGAVELGLDCLRRYLQGLPGHRAHRFRARVRRRDHEPRRDKIGHYIAARTNG